MLASLPALLCLAAGCGNAALQQSVIEASAAWTRATPPGRAEAAVYFTIANRGNAADRLVAVRTTAAAAASLHATEHGAGGMMTMRPLDGLDLPAGAQVEFAPMGRHVMLTGLLGPLAEGESIPLVLEFAHAPAVTLQVTVQALVPAAAAVPGAGGAMGEHHHE